MHGETVKFTIYLTVKFVCVLKKIEKVYVGTGCCLRNYILLFSLFFALVGKPEGKRPLGRPRRRCEDNIKMDLQEVEGGCGDWMELGQDRETWQALVTTLMNFWVS